MGTKKIILIFFLAFYFSCGFYQAKIFHSDQKVVVVKQVNRNHNVDGDTRIEVDNKYGHAAEAHIGGGGRGSGGEVNSDGSRSPSNPGSSNFIPIYAANAHHNRHRGAASSHDGGRNKYLAALCVATLFACLCT